MSIEELSIRQALESKPPAEKQDKASLLRLRLQLRELKSKAKAYGNLHPNDAALFAALDMAIDAPSKVNTEVEKLELAKSRLMKTNPEDPKTQTRIKYLEYQAWFTMEHAKRAAQEAVRRKRHLQSLLNNPEKQKAEMEKCRLDIEYWFDNYAWILDPRNSLLFAFPFQLFEFQRESLGWLREQIYVMRSDALIDKSRDMGVTWLIVGMGVYDWTFPNEGAQFHGLVSSYTADEVDKTGVPSTVFEKIRSQIRLLPSWMLPEGLDMKKHLTYMKCINPSNGSTITGATANAETGRSGRYTWIFFDEFASVEQDVSSATAASQSTNTRIFVSTPKGKLNYFAQLRFTGDIPIRSFHWTRHPLKDDRWYAGQKLKMSPEMVAQELDIDYDASQPGKVYPAYNEVYHVITKSVFMQEVPGAIRIDEDGSRHFRIPTDWMLGRAHDWGSSDSGGEHANVTLWFARARQGTRTRTHKIDLAGAVFVYREHIAPPHSTVRQVAQAVHKYQFADREQERMTDELMSHEALSERDTYEQEHNLYYKAWNTDYNAGIAQVRDYLEVQFVHQPHPFRNLDPNENLPRVKGRPMIYIIVDDDQGECYFDESMNKWQVRPSRDSAGLHRLRSEIGVYHYPKSESGKPVRKQRPEKMFDDAMDCLRCMAVTFPPVAQYTIDEQLERHLPAGLRLEAGMAEPDPDEKARIWFARTHYLAEEKLRERLLNQHLHLSRRDRVFQKARQGR